MALTMVIYNSVLLRFGTYWYILSSLFVSLGKGFIYDYQIEPIEPIKPIKTIKTIKPIKTLKPTGKK